MARATDISTNTLTRERIVDCALRMADNEGLENLSIRKIATELGKSPMALYRHFDSIYDIKQGVIARIFAEVDTCPIAGERWDDTIRRTSRSIRAVELAHARAHLYRESGNGTSLGLREHTRRVAALHGAQNIPPAVFEKMWRIVDAFLGGFLTTEVKQLEAHEVRGTGDAHDANDGRDVSDTCDADGAGERDELDLRDKGGENLTSKASGGAETDVPWLDTVEGAYSEQAFADGIEIIIAGIRGLAAPDPCEWHTPTR